MGYYILIGIYLLIGFYFAGRCVGVLSERKSDLIKMGKKKRVIAIVLVIILSSLYIPLWPILLMFGIGMATQAGSDYVEKKDS